jgi:nitroreductase
MWDFFETVRHRHSVRSYQDDLSVEKEKLHAILETACAAPSAGDLQSYRIAVVSDPEQRQELMKAAHNQAFISEAPVSLVFLTDARRSAEKYGERGENLYTVQDATIAASYAQLATVAAGMASAWVGDFDAQAVANVVSADEGLVPVAIICLGYPAELPEATPRRNLDEILISR